MADRDNSNDTRAAPASSGNVNAQTDDEDDLMGSTEGVGPTNEAAENAIRALGNHDEERNAENGPQEGGEEEESKESITVVYKISHIKLYLRIRKRVRICNILHVMNTSIKTRKRSEFLSGIEPMTFHTPVRHSYHYSMLLRDLSAYVI